MLATDKPTNFCFRSAFEIVCWVVIYNLFIMDLMSRKEIDFSMLNLIIIIYEIDLHTKGLNRRQTTNISLPKEDMARDFPPKKNLG